MQLMLFVWHSFSMDVRKTLLTHCANSLVTVSKSIEYEFHTHTHTHTLFLIVFVRKI